MNSKSLKTLRAMIRVQVGHLPLRGYDKHPSGMTTNAAGTQRETYRAAKRSLATGTLRRPTGIFR